MAWPRFRHDDGVKIPSETDLLNIYINKIKQHSNVDKSLKSMRLLITNLLNGTDTNNKKWLKKFVSDDLLQLIINDMIFYKSLNTDKYKFDNLRQHILFIHFLCDWSEYSPIPFNIEPKQLFEEFVINTNDDIQRFVMLELFISMIWRSYLNYQQLKLFYNLCLKPLIIKYSKNKNYSMIINIYYCFSIYFIKIENNNDSTQCLKDLNLNKIEITQFLMNELRETIKTDNKFKLHHLLHCLKDIFISTEKLKRVRFVDENNNITNKMQLILNNVFNTFATTPDGSMCYNDMRRYIVSTGKDINNASKTRLRYIFNDQEKLDFNGFYNFYKSAIIQKPDSVWNDIIRFGYKYDLESEFKEIKEDENEDDEIVNVRDIIAKDVDYYKILSKYFENHEDDNDNNNNNNGNNYNWHIFEMMHSLPKSYKYQQEIYNLEFERLFDNNLYKMIYTVLCINSITIGLDTEIAKKWRCKFIKNGKLNALCAMLLGFYYRGRNDYKYYKNHEGYQLGRSLLFKSLYWFEGPYLDHPVTIHCFMHAKLVKFNSIDLFSDDEIMSLVNMKKNNLIQMMCLVAKKMTSKTVCPIKAAKVCNIMPSKILELYADPLVVGYIKENASNIKLSNDIIHLLLKFSFGDGGGCHY